MENRSNESLFTSDLCRFVDGQGRVRREIEDRNRNFVDDMVGDIDQWCVRRDDRRYLYRHFTASTVATVLLCVLVWHFTPQPTSYIVDRASASCRAELVASVDKLFLS